jgi:prevent-host-death family protein
MKINKPITYTLKPAKPVELKDAVALPHLGLTMPVRAAKAKLSALLDFVASGNSVTITSDGEPKAVLRPVTPAEEHVGFEPAWDLLEAMPVQTEGPLSTELVRADRDGRGW